MIIGIYSMTQKFIELNGLTKTRATLTQYFSLRQYETILILPMGEARKAPFQPVWQPMPTATRVANSRF